MLTSRMKRVIRILLKTEDYITIASIANDVEVSSRTILRELDEITRWVEQHGASVETKKGKGLRFVPGTASAEEIGKLLKDAQGEVIFTPEDRRMIIRAKLLQYYEPVKLFVLTSPLYVTESTISHDLEELNQWFYQYKLIVSKKPGLGILVQGSETARRKAIVSLIYEHFHVNELIQVILNRSLDSQDVLTIESHLNSAILDLLDVNSLKAIREITEAIEEEMGIQFADNGYIALALRCAVTLKRRTFWGEIELDESMIGSLKNDKIYKFMRNYLDEHMNHPFNELPLKELVYLTIHIKGTKVRDSGEHTKVSMIEDFKIIRLVKEFLEKAEAESGVYLSDNERLMTGLVKHLRPAIYRMKMDLDIINPLVEEIKQMYPKLFKAIKRSVSIIEDKENIRIPDDEIAFLAIHIGSVIRKAEPIKKARYRVVVACMYGIGTSSFLVSQIKDQFPNLIITSVISVIDEQIAALKPEDADFVIATVPVGHSELPVVHIDPILKTRDIDKIKELMGNLLPYESKKYFGYHADFKDKLLGLREYSDLIIQIIDNYSYTIIEKAQYLEEIIEQVSHDLSESEEEYKDLSNAFTRREEKGSTLLSKKGIILLHCRVDIEKHLALKVVQLEEPLFMEKYGQRIPIHLVIVMVAPVTLKPKTLEIMSDVSRHIIAEGFADIILSKDEMAIREQLMGIMEKFYESKVLSGE